MPTKDEIINEILIRMPDFENASEANKDTCVQVAQFLSEGDKRLDRLKALEDAMEFEINKRLAEQSKGKLTDVTKSALVTAFAGRTKAQPIVGGSKLAPEYRKILSTVLQKNEQSYSFSFNTFLGYVPEAKFREQLQNGAQFKDPTVPGVHGEFTHRIQWYMITASGGGLTMPADGWLNFYKWVGGVEHTKAATDDKPKWKVLGLWDALFDRNPKKGDNANGPYNTQSKKDFRSPENLNLYLLEGKLSTCPLLLAFLQGRFEKRWNMKLISNVETEQQPALENYVAKKLFKKSYNTLTSEEKIGVNNKLSGHIL